MKRAALNILIIFFCVLTAFAQERRTVEIQALFPPEKIVSFPEKKIAIVAMHYKNTDQNLNAKSIFDSVNINTVALGVQKTLEESPIFNGINIPIYNIYADTSQIGKSLQISDLQDMEKQTGAKTIIEIEFANIKSTQIIKLQKPVSTNVNFFVIIKAYNTTSGEVETKYVLKNNIKLDAFYNQDGKFIAAPTTSEANVATAESIGISFAKGIIPNWENVKRMIFFDTYESDTNLCNAYHSIRIQNWSTATEWWTKALNYKMSSTKRAKIMYNIAVGCEILGKYELALKWLDEAQKTSTKIRNDIEIYSNIITQRIKDKETLDTLM